MLGALGVERGGECLLGGAASEQDTGENGLTSSAEIGPRILEKPGGRTPQRAENLTVVPGHDRIGRREHGR